MKGTAFSLALCGVILFSVASFKRNEVYSTELAFWQTAAHQSANKRRPHQNYGAALSKSGRYDEALVQFEQVLALDDDSIPVADTFREMGTVYFWLGQYDRAISTWLEGLPYSPPRDGRLLEHIALGYIYKQDYEAALSYGERARDANPRRADTWNTLGDIYLKKARYDDASNCFLKAVDLEPDKAFRYLNAALALEKAGRYEEAYRNMSTYADRTTDSGKRRLANQFLEQAKKKIRLNNAQWNSRTAGWLSQSRFP